MSGGLVLFGAGSVEQIGRLARELGFLRTLLVADRGLVAAGHVDSLSRLLRKSGLEVFPFHEFETNPDTAMVQAGSAFAAPLNVDSIIGLGGGSSLDCAKAINFVLTYGGRVRDYQGFGKATKPMLPMIGVPTTAGTGSEAQTCPQKISLPRTHCGALGKQHLPGLKFLLNLRHLPDPVCHHTQEYTRQPDGHDAQRIKDDRLLELAHPASSQAKDTEGCFDAQNPSPSGRPDPRRGTMNRSLPLKRPYGFFAASPEMLRALDLLSDGTFKVFVYCALKASRHTGQCVTSSQELARATGGYYGRWVFKEAAEPEGCRSLAFCLLQFLPDSQQPEGNACDGGRNYRSHLGD